MMGVLCSIGSVILWSAASVSIRKISGYYDPVQTALYGMVIALVFNVPAAVIENVLARKPSDGCGHRRMPVCGGIWYGGGTHCWNKALQLLNASACSMFYPLQPLVSCGDGCTCFT
ncbi:MAG: EamA family transporter [Clostridium sp.]